MKILEISGITKEFGGIKALNNVSFSINKGTITALIGPNGAGKTTLINILSGFLKADEGKILFKGKDITGLPPYKLARIGITRTFQGTRLFPQLTALENILLAIRFRYGERLDDVIFKSGKISEEERRNTEKALNILKLVGLIDKKDELAENLSYGQRKLLELGRALATGAELFLLDEPFAGVFPEMRKKIASVIKDMKNMGKTIIFIEHMMDIVAEISDRAIVLKHGEKIAEGSTPDVLKDERVIREYLGGGEI